MQKPISLITKDDPLLRTIKPIGDRARELSKLLEHPSWEILKSEFEDRKAAANSRLAHELMAGAEDAPLLNQRHIDYRRGFIRGAAAVLEHPEHALRLLERELNKEEQAI